MSKTHSSIMANLFFSRLHIATSRDTADKVDFLLIGLRNDARTDFREFLYKFFDTEVVEFDGKEFISGQLVKYNPADIERVVDESEQKIVDEDVKNKVVGMSRFIIDASSSIVMFMEVPNVISRETFVNRFTELFKKNYDDYFIELSITPIKEQYSFIETIRKFRAVKQISITLFPSNPNFADRWKVIDERLRNNHITKYKETQENNISGQNIRIDEETENKFLMAEDGYGESHASGIDENGNERTISTKDEVKHISKQIPPDMDKITDVLLVIAETLQTIVNRTQ